MNRYLIYTLSALVISGLWIGCGRDRRESVLSNSGSVAVDSTAANVSISVDPTIVQRKITRQILGQGVWFSWQAYAWDSANNRTFPDALQLFADLGMGVVGHYPGVGVITHDFNWKNMIGPRSQRTDPTPRQKEFDTSQSLEFGPDEYGRFVEEYRTVTGLPVEGSIQVNIVNGTAEEAADWVEYMNAPNDGSNPGGGVDWASVRAENGHPDPYRIHYWEFGNEPHFTASKIGHLTAQEYVNRIIEFAPLMKSRDPSIEVMGYVNPFQIGNPDVLGLATRDIPVGQGLTWSQKVIRDAGEHLDYFYFHWYGGWNDRRTDYEFAMSSMYFGLIPWLDRLAQDVATYAPNKEHRVFIPEWNVYGGWFTPVTKGTAMHGALANSRTLHVFTSRSEIQGAEHLGLFAPYPAPRMRPFFADIRDGYFLFRGREDESEYMGTAAAAVAQLWSDAFASDVVSATASNMPLFSNGIPALDVSAFRSETGDELNIIITNAFSETVNVDVNLSNFLAQAEATRLSVLGERASDNNSWEKKDKITLNEGAIQINNTGFTIAVSPQSVEAVLLKRAGLEQAMLPIVLEE